MHEAAIAQSLLDALLAEVRNQTGKPVAAKISCGAFAGVNNETLSFAFEAVSKGTLCEGLKLTIEQKPILARCKNCQTIYVFDVHQPACTRCRQDKFELLPDEPLLLNEIEFEEK